MSVPPALGEIARPPPCNFTRSELMKALADSGYGANVAAYKAWFRTTSDGTNVCATCGLPPGHHGADAPPPAAALGSGDDAATVLLRPTADLAELIAAKQAAKQTVAARPAHWASASAFAPLLEYDGIAALDVPSTRRRAVTHGHTQWRCCITDASGDACGEVITIAGATVSAAGPLPGSAVDFGAIDAKIREEAESPLATHMRVAHGLVQHPAGRWTERFCGLCDDPRAAATVLCPVLDIDMGRHCRASCPADEGAGICCANYRTLTNALASQSVIVAAAPLDRAQCGCMNCGIFVLLPVALHFSACVVLAVLLSVVTMCGFPCNSDAFPPLVCWCCFQNRRRMVKLLGAAESNCESRCKVLLCCPCSETQIWREIRASGVWPGLLCCTANEEDREIMSAGSVRRRYQLADGSAAGAAATGTRESQLALAQLMEAAPPKIGFAME